MNENGNRLRANQKYVLFVAILVAGCSWSSEENATSSNKLNSKSAKSLLIGNWHQDREEIKKELASIPFKKNEDRDNRRKRITYEVSQSWRRFEFASNGQFVESSNMPNQKRVIEGTWKIIREHEAEVEVELAYNSKKPADKFVKQKVTVTISFESDSRIRLKRSTGKKPHVLNLVRS